MSKISAFACWLGSPPFPGIVPALHAAEEITLKNGFNLVCDHREQAGDKVRLFTSQGSSNFVEVDAAEIASVDLVPDVPASKDSQKAAAPAPKLTNADVHELIAQAGA